MTATTAAPAKYAVLSGDGTWPEVTLSGLARRADGRLVAAADPGDPGDPVALTAGPLDAGEEQTWTRLVVDAVVPSGAALMVEWASAPTAAASPAWIAAPAADSPIAADRHLWLRVRVTPPSIADPLPGASARADGRVAAPDAPLVITEIRAETAGESYLDHLPAVYAREAAPGDLLHQLLTLAKARLGDLEDDIRAAANMIDPAVAPAALLPWLAGWEAFRPPAHLLAPEQAERLRAVVAELPDLMERRGTPAGIARIAEIETGVRPVIVEDFRLRHLWMLGEGSGLGFDTATPAVSPDGLLVGAATTGASGPADPQAWGANLFERTAHRFTVLAPACWPGGDDGRARLHAVLDAEKPAHTDYHLCLHEASYRVGIQGFVGLDAIVAGGPPPLTLDGGQRLGKSSHLPAHGPAAPGTVGSKASLGVDTLVG